MPLDLMSAQDASARMALGGNAQTKAQPGRRTRGPESVVPVSLMMAFLEGLERDSAIITRRIGPETARTMTKIADELRSLLEDPVHRWVEVEEAARFYRKSAETIRRWCRDEMAPFTFRKGDNGRYEIWLADLTANLELPDAA